MEFLAAKLQMRTESQNGFSVVLGSRISSSLQNLKVMTMSRTLLLWLLTLAFVFAFRSFSEKSDYLTLKWHPNKIDTRFLRLCDSIKPLLL